MGIMNNYQGGEQIYGQNSQNGFWVWENTNAQDYSGNREFGYVPPNQYKDRLEAKMGEKPVEAAHDPLKAANLNECPRVRDAPTVKIFWIIFLCMMLGMLVS